MAAVSFSELYVGQFDEVCSNLERGLFASQDLLDFFKKKASVEQDYAKAQIKLCDSFPSSAKFFARGPPALDNEIDALKVPIFGVRDKLRAIADQHSAFSEQILNSLCSPLEDFIKLTTAERKKVQQDGQNKIQENKTALQDALKAKDRYVKLNKRMEDTCESLAKAESHANNNPDKPHLKRACEKFTATIDDLKKKIEASTEEYRKSVDKANSTQAALLEKELPSLLKSLQDMEQNRFTVVQTALKEFAALQLKVLEEKCSDMCQTIEEAKLEKFLSDYASAYPKSNDSSPEWLSFEQHQSELPKQEDTDTTEESKSTVERSSSNQPKEESVTDELEKKEEKKAETTEDANRGLSGLFGRFFGSSAKEIKKESERPRSETEESSAPIAQEAQSNQEPTEAESKDGQSFLSNELDIDNEDEEDATAKESQQASRERKKIATEEDIFAGSDTYTDNFFSDFADSASRGTDDEFLALTSSTNESKDADLFGADDDDEDDILDLLTAKRPEQPARPPIQQKQEASASSGQVKGLQGDSSKLETQGGRIVKPAAPRPRQLVKGPPGQRKSGPQLRRKPVPKPLSKRKAAPKPGAANTKPAASPKPADLFQENLVDDVFDALTPSPAGSHHSAAKKSTKKLISDDFDDLFDF